jgi:hypothetical protein
MSTQQPSTKKKRKSNEVVATEINSVAGSANIPYQTSQYYASPQNYAPQYSHHGSYPYPTTHQYPYHPSPLEYGKMPPSGYPTSHQMHHAAMHGAAYHAPPPSNSLVSPETQQSSSSPAFASPPSSLRRHHLDVAEKGSSTTVRGKKNRSGMFIHFLLKWCLFFPFMIFEFILFRAPTL